MWLSACLGLTCACALSCWCSPVSSPFQVLSRALLFGGCCFASGWNQHKGHGHQVKEVHLLLLKFKAVR